MYLSQHITEILLLLFIIITFGISGVEKMFDWPEQTQFLRTHFKGTIFQERVKLFLGILVILDLFCVVFSAVGIYQLIASSELYFAKLASIFAAIILLCLLLGQRVAKDYQGALTITCYFMVVIFSVWLFHSK